MLKWLQLIELLMLKQNYYQQYMILKYNNDNFDINEKDLMENKISVDEYEKIIKNTNGSLSINLPLPDYTKL